MADKAKEALSFVHAALLKSAKKSGVDPSQRSKSEFDGDEEGKQTFIDAWGQEAYDNLKD